MDHTSRGWLQLPPTFSFLLPACAHTKVTTRLRVNTSSSNSNPASSDLSAAQPKYIFRHASPEGPALQLTRLDDMLIITLDGDVSYCLRMHSVERRMSYLCQTGGG